MKFKSKNLKYAQKEFFLDDLKVGFVSYFEDNSGEIVIDNVTFYVHHSVIDSRNEYKTLHKGQKVLVIPVVLNGFNQIDYVMPWRE